ncbi:Bug family tripartite tricarboxylate transporter substrate binding protein [Streptomonospora nanhaiensis]|uniref:Bug family tripartite tricarboxylate transporter substrate binding protein n=1 Tax=Streptomonospora nanhaiensis TaxID=1323731 RepID=UPI001C38582D|nr:tripartite tricarboxylate transporter substrate binding protein [Streptomonospora nanhaiensis]MBV2364338.1 tripartite tricarboxylate transporter substrate binding protein [Streptomonospora nanhaiensis]MBX9391594.1 tripartite tricarboxylate transporter substrate binding protein [Streptomonospora nanhaiensis]
MIQLPSGRNVRRGAVSALAVTATLSAAACGGNLGGGAGGGDEFPQGPITMLVGQDAGGSTDLIARALAEGASEELGVAMPVENAPGANGALAANQLAEEDPNGQHLMVINASLTAITPLAVSDEEAVDINDYEVVTGVSRDDYVLVTAAASDYDSLQDVVDAGGGLKFGTTGVGTGSQLAQELLFEQAGVDGTAVPFTGGSPTLTAVLGEEVDVAAVQLGEAIAQIEAGELVPLVTFSEDTNQYLPDVPTAVEEGYEVRVSQYRAVVAPAGTPEEVVEELRTAFTAVFETDSYRSFNEDNLLTPHEIEPAQVTEEWTGYLEEYRGMVEEYGIDLSEER